MRSWRRCGSSDAGRESLRLSATPSRRSAPTSGVEEVRVKGPVRDRCPDEPGNASRDGGVDDAGRTLVTATTEHDQLQRLASLITQRNRLDAEIAATIGRPAHPGHIGRFVAAVVFDIRLFESATHRGAAGRFARGPLAGRSVHVRKYSTDQGLLDIRPDALPDFFLVLTGARTPPASSRGTTQPWTIESVYLLEANPLVELLHARGVKIGVATSVRRHIWDDAEIYPSPNNRALRLTAEQVSMIELFGGR